LTSFLIWIAKVISAFLLEPVISGGVQSAKESDIMYELYTFEQNRPSLSNQSFHMMTIMASLVNK